MTGGDVMTGTGGTAIVSSQSLNTAGIVTQAGTDGKEAILDIVTAGGTTTAETDLMFEQTLVGGTKVPEIVTIPSGTPAGTHFRTKRPYHTANKIVNTAAAGTGVTVTITTLAGATSATPGRAVRSDLEVKAIKAISGKFVDLFLPQIWFTNETFSYEDANSHIGQPMDFVMDDADAFYEHYLD
jgi:hypothetical protein